MSAPPQIVGNPSLTATVATQQKQSNEQAQNQVASGQGLQVVPIADSMAPADAAPTITGNDVAVADTMAPTDAVAAASGPIAVINGTYARIGVAVIDN